MDGTEGLKLGDYGRVIRLPEVNVFTDLNYLGFPTVTTTEKEPSVMHLTVVRFYFPLSAKIPHLTFWQKLTAPHFGHYMVKKAKEHGIEQAIVHRVSGGFLKGDHPTHYHSETVSPRMPQCLELIDLEHKLHDFIEAHKHLFKGIKIVKLSNAMLMDLSHEEPVAEAA
jgi:PII-like signaling protein